MTISPPVSTGGALGRLRQQATPLSPTLRRVAEHVIRHADSVVHQTITELASGAGVSEATVTRLCRKLGFAGFHAFKIALASDVASRDALPTEDLALDPASRLVRHTCQTLEDTAQLINPGVLESVAQAIARAPRVDLTGQGNSGLVAQYFAHRLMRIGITAVTYTDPHIAAVSVSTLPRNGVVIGISSSGSTIDTVQHLRLAHSHQHYTVALVHRPSSPITRHASAVLFSAAQEDPLTDAVLSTISSQMLMLELLYMAVLAHRPEAHAMLRVTAESVVEKKY
ncbi:MurR/RpiR family transcriptional regulator (plasmid) [Deinococcus taeanensis]|uniref:MurR/RpiR family transcriptional regulator n=1 Tax=Deinococcus taeanensis TaxID=2737050 RepID=UPI001CDC2D23|nr:MurR/RpiR family transcriptional regulator [Deinococcus taeanensis]UBV44915.1 MurR/RpiR family transcriptional regulator [Deinococcus taeanensis]